MNSASPNCVITGDIKGSRAFDPEAWRIIQRKIKTTLTEINKIYSSDLLRNFTITRDDEFQGVLRSPEKLKCSFKSHYYNS
ncbi:MAG: SatD family protein [Candidatus Methanospirareceae archaeon]